MTWRMLPPVLSPVSPATLWVGARTTIGIAPATSNSPEAALCAQYRMRDVTLTNSGTSALVLALRAVTRPGSTVALPAYACIDLTTAALAAGVRVRLYDLHPGTLSPDLDSVRSAIARGADALVVAHLFGYPADVRGVRRIADEYGIPVIEDAAQGAGGSLGGERLGALADIAVLSFGRGKGMTAGSGGALMTRTPGLATRMKEFRDRLPRANAGSEVLTLAAQYLFSHPNLYRLPASIPALKLGEMVYHPPSEPKAISATARALLPLALEMDASEVAMRRARAGIFLARAGSYAAAAPARPVAGGEPGYLRFAMLGTAVMLRPPVSLGVASGYPLTLEQHGQLQPLLHPGERAGKGARMLRDRLFTLPTHSRVSAADVSRLLEWLGAPVRRDVVLAPAGA